MRSSRIFYGWYVVAGGFVLAASLGETFWTFGVFFKPLENEFGWSRATISSGYTAFLIGYFISAAAGGRLGDKYDPRLILGVSAVLSGLGIALCSLTESINQLRFFLLIAGLGGGATWSIPTAVVQRWFYGSKRAGLALSIVITGIGVGGLVFAPFINWLIQDYGWRNAYLVVGILFFIMVGASSFLIKQSPTYKQESRGGRVTTPETPGSGADSSRRLVLTAPFMALVFIMSIGAIGFSIVSVHLIPYAMDNGVSATAAATALGFMGGFSIPGRLMAGFLSDRIGWRKVLALSFLMTASGMVVLLFVRTLWVLYLFTFVYGMSQGTRSPAQVGIVSELFGMRSLGEFIGISSGIAWFISAFAPYVAGFSFDATGSYAVVFVIVTVFLFAGSVIAVMLKKPRYVDT